MKLLKQPSIPPEQSQWNPLFPDVLSVFLCQLCLLLSKQNLYFLLQFSYYDYEFEFSFICVGRVYIYYKCLSVHWFLFTFCLTWLLFVDFFSFCCSEDYVITSLAEICETVNGTKTHTHIHTRQVGLNLEKLLRPPESDNTDYNLSLYVYISRDILKMFVVSFLFVLE